LSLTFLGLAGLWFIIWALPLTVWDSSSLRRVTRALGYVALAGLLVPYVHIGRRLLLNRRAVLGIPLGNLTGWMWWHLVAAYLAFFFTLLHSRAHGSSGLTFAILVLLWAVMVSGVVGFFGMRACYRLLALTVEREVGLERLVREREELSERSRALVRNHALLREEDVSDWRSFCSKMLQKGTPLHAKLGGALGKGVVTVIEDALRSGSFPVQLQAEVVEKVNAQLMKPEFSQAKDFQDLDASAPAGRPLHQAAGAPRPAAQGERQQRLAKEIAQWATNQPNSGQETERRNRVFLEALCPSEIAESRAPPEAVERFFEQAATYLQTGYPSWTWLFSPRALDPVSWNHYHRVRELASPEQCRLIDELWEFVQRRRELDVEYWFHRLARVWLLVHGPGAWALLALVAAHVVSSVYYGGFF
jgi:hypothetical protein